MIWQSKKETSPSPGNRGTRVLAALVAAGVISFAALVPASSATVPADDYIVLLKSGADAPELAREERRRGNEIEDVFDSRVNGLVAKLNRADVKRLRQDPDVAIVERDGVVRALGVRDSFTSLWGLDRIDQRTRPGNGRITTQTDGSGVTAYVIDTGIKSDHEQFEDRVAARGFSAFADRYGWTDCQGHGTHVAGTVAGKEYGVAPKAELVAVRVLDCQGYGSWSGVIAGIDWAASDHPAGAPAVANLSLGGGYSSSINLAIQRLSNDGVSVAVAAGNENSNACSASPASAPEAITVGATTSTDARASFSNFGSCLDVFAPGAGILSATQVSTTSTASWSGTSMASPHVAGAASLLLSGEPGLTPTQVADRISNASTTGVVTGPGTGSPNRLLYVGSSSSPNPAPEPEPEPEPAPPPPTSPANDPFAGAETISLAGTTGTSAAATREAGEPDHGWGASRSVWYRWTAPSNGTLMLNTEGSGYDTVLAAYSGSSFGSLSKLAANDDNGSGGLWSRITFTVSAGTTYRVAVDGYNGATGPILLAGEFTPVAAPPPDTTPPDPPTITTTPDPVSYSDSATFTFTGGSTGSFQCSLDSSTWVECASPRKITGLAEGARLFRVRQADAAGNVSSPVSFAWEVRPVVEGRTPTLSGPGASGTLTFGGAAAAETYLCRVGESTSGPLRECDNPFVPDGLTDGTYSYRLAISDDRGNRSPELAGSFTVSDTPAPPAGQIGVSINGGDLFTADRQVNLNLVWPAGTRQVIVSGDGALDAAPVPVTTPLAWALPSSGSERLPKVAYVRFLGAGGSVLGTHTDDILLDETAPRVAAGRLLRRSGKKFTLRLPASDQGSGLARFELAASRVRPRSTRSALPRLSHRASGKLLEVRSSVQPRWYRASDRAGNWSRWASIRRLAR